MEDIVQARFRKIREEDLEMIMNWRMMPEVTKYMNTDPELTMEDQRRWYAAIREDEKRGLQEGRRGIHWILEVDDIPVGYASLVDIDWTSLHLQTGCYVAVKKARSIRLAVDIQVNLYQYAFEVLGMNKVYEEVFAENKALNRILDMCGSRSEGVLREHVFKHGKYYDVVTRGILKTEWETQRAKFSYNHFLFE